MAVVPKRSNERVRRNLADPITKIPFVGDGVKAPPLDMLGAHPLVKELYQAMQDSAQASFYEPSDWVTAKVTFHFLDKLLKSATPSAMMLASVNSMLTSLLLTEGDRRRVRIEVERDTASGTVVDMAKLFRDQLERSTGTS